MIFRTNCPQFCCHLSCKQILPPWAEILCCSSRVTMDLLCIADPATIWLGVYVSLKKRILGKLVTCSLLMKILFHLTHTVKVTWEYWMFGVFTLFWGIFAHLCCLWQSFYFQTSTFHIRRKNNTKHRRLALFGNFRLIMRYSSELFHYLLSDLKQEAFSHILTK